ncbi:ankyrin repeat domain-containing protein [Novosphingobium umbonatum]|uniref:Ankyrin repeat domain-containing protein n=1 Tax=Novosphingobium umbonatum TaxID=1908524 RepID=A0A437N6X5_9SPHN|nr:ankyrin repeat domain-containing protein [Novosphingobium umbonatum]RVU05674.1 ankyrin repeat domain-containing protein [Novosphingobium umbonatum]
MRKWLLIASLLASSPAPAQDLAEAIRLGDARGVTAHLTAQPALANQALAYGETPLMLTVSHQDHQAAKALLKAGAKVNAQDQDGVSALWLACELGDGAIIAALLDAGANPLLARSDGATALHVCARFGPAAALQRMAKGPIDVADAKGQTPLMWAASSGRAEAVEVLLKAGASVKSVSKGGFNPLFFAVKAGSAAAVSNLLAAGADPMFRGPENTSAAQLAAYQKRWDVLALLVQNGGVDLAERDREGWQLLHRAAAGGDVALIRLLITTGAAVEGLSGPSRITWVTEANFGVAPPPVPPKVPLFMAAETGQADAIKALITAGAKADFVAGDGENLLIAAARSQKLPALEAALAALPKPDMADAKGNSALHILAGSRPAPDLPLMLAAMAKAGARPDLPNARGATPAKIAAGAQTEVRRAFEAAFPPRLAGGQ